MEKLCLWSVLFGTLLAGCTTFSPQTNWPETRPLGQEILPNPSTKNSTPLPANLSSSQEPSGSLSLIQALTLALLRSPELAYYSIEIRAKEAESLQASLYPNPEIGVEFEDFGKRKEPFFDSTETTLQISQLIPLSSRLQDHTRFLSLERDLAAWDYETKRLEVFNQTTQAFIQVLEAQENLQLAKDTQELSQQISKIVSERVKAGIVAPLEGYRTQIPASKSELEFLKAQQNLHSAKKKLSLLWGNAQPTFQQANGNYYHVLPFPPEEEIQNKLFQNPQIARFLIEKEKQHARLQWEESKQVPDITVDAGIRHLNGEDTTAFLFGVSLPIPLFDRNQGAITEAKHRITQTELSEEIVKRRLQTKLSESYQHLSNAFKETVLLKEKMIPNAKSVFNSATAGYQQGKFSYLEVLDAEQLLFELRAQYIKALSQYHQTLAEVELLISQKLTQSSTSQTVSEVSHE